MIVAADLELFTVVDSAVGVLKTIFRFDDTHGLEFSEAELEVQLNR